MRAVAASPILLCCARAAFGQAAARPGRRAMSAMSASSRGGHLSHTMGGERAPPRALECASGTGQHIAELARSYPAVEWTPTDLTDESFGSVAAWCAGLPNVAPPRVLDAAAPWPAELAELALVYCANMCHIAPFAATEGLVAGAARALRAGGALCIYGPFTVDGGRFTTPSNEQFDAALRARDPRWGYRDVEDLRKLAADGGMALVEKHDMPANNFMLVFRKE